MSGAELVWSFFPSYLALFYYLLFKNIDIFYRITQPYADLLYGKAPVIALELNYASDIFPLITFKAIKNRHWRVALASLISFACSFLPVYATSMFYLGYPDGVDELRLVINLPALHFAIAIMAILCFVFLLLIPTRLYFMPHQLETLADHLSMLYGSTLRHEQAFTFVPDDNSFKARVKTMLFDPEPSKELKAFREGNEQDGFAMGIRRRCILEPQGARCTGPHGICIDAHNEVDCFYEDVEKKPYFRERVKHFFKSHSD